MGCGCGGKKTVLAPPSNQRAATVQTAQPRTYDVIGSDGSLVASTTNPVLARSEARRVGGTVVLRELTSASQA